MGRDKNGLPIFNFQLPIANLRINFLQVAVGNRKMEILQRPARCRARRPRPLEIETAEMAGYVHYFANEE
jgi:hypothetical protein